MTVACVGGGPAGLFLSLLLKKARPEWRVSVHERNPRGNTFGWGIVFSDGTMENLEAADPEVARLTRESLAHWDDIEVRIQDRVLQSSGHGFIGVGRHRFLEILTDRAEAVGVDLQFGHEIADPLAITADLIVAADGVNSRVRAVLADALGASVEPQQNRYTWLGTTRPFPAFTFDFQKTEHGWFQAHAYQFSDEMSTCIVECTEATWRAAGLDAMSKPDSLAFCETLFADLLDGHPLLDNSPHLDGPAPWLRFPKVTCERWYHGHVVLLGDSSATAHFSIGSGTKLALESAIALARHLAALGDTGVDHGPQTPDSDAPAPPRSSLPPEQGTGAVDQASADSPRLGAEADDLTRALAAYEDERRVEVLKLQNAARNSTEWFESVELRGGLAPEQFAYSLLTRSQRVSHENLRLRDRAWLEDYERWWGDEHAPDVAPKAPRGPSSVVRRPPPRPPFAVPFQLRGLTLPNRVAVSPMAMYSARDGLVGDFHLVHLGARALGGAGLVFTEMTCVSPDARITPGCAGLWTDEQTDAYRRIVDFIHAHGPARAALQLGHAGRKGATKVPWEADGKDTAPIADPWPLIAPSPLPYLPHMPVPREMTRDDMDRVLADFVAATRRGARAGFDLLELHCAHGYLLSTFLSPLTNVREDEYGGSRENRVRFPLEIFRAMREAWPEDRPMSVRLSAVDWVDGGTTLDDAVHYARAFAEAGADALDVSTGQVSPDQAPVYGRMWQTPFAERIRLELDVPVMAVGNIYEPDHVNSILAAGRADLCLLARPHLTDPQWTLRAAAEVGYTEQWWPPQYLSAKRQIERIYERQREAED